jgi:hypothetical protein
MKKWISILLILSILASFGCGAFAENTEETAAADRIEMKTFPVCVYSSKDIWKEDFPLYFLDGAEDLPYADLKDWAEFMSMIFEREKDMSYRGFQVTCEVQEDGNIVTLTRENGFTMEADFAEGMIRYVDYLGFLQRTNGSYMDVGMFIEEDNNGQPFLLQRIDGRNLYGDFTDLDLNGYGIRMIAQDGKYLVPLQTLAGFSFAPIGVGVYFNGEGIFVESVSSMKHPAITFNEKLNAYLLSTPDLLKKYQEFQGTAEEQKNMLLEELGKTQEGAAMLDEYDQAMDSGIAVKYYSVPAVPRSEALIDYGYRELCLELDSFYGLKDVHNIRDFDLYFMQTGQPPLFEDLLDPDAAKADDAILRMTQFWMDDGHSTFVSRSCMSATTPEDNFGVALLARGQQQTIIQNARAKYPEASLPYYEVGDTAYVTFDSFKYTEGEVGEYADYYALSESGELPSDTVGIIAEAHRQITRENSPIKNVVLDLSCNGGGNAATALYVLGWFLGEAQLSLTNTFTGAQTTSYFRADVNLDHRFNEEDTLVNRGLNLFCLTSPQSFSCGNLVPWAFKANGGVTLLGRVSGGGSCAVQFATTAWGTSYRISGMKRMSFMKNGAYYDVDQGVEPDFIIQNYEHFYDRAALTEFIHGLY